MHNVEVSYGITHRPADQPQVSVVVVTCNGSAKLPQLIGALRNQTISGRVAFEVVMIDNRSTDGTADVIRAYDNDPAMPIVCGYEGRAGKAYGLNTGVTIARAPILAFTDDDGVPAPDWLESILDHFQSHAEIDCIGGRVELYDSDDAAVTVRLSEQPMTLDVETFPVCNVPVIGCNLAIRAESLLRAGGFDTTIGPGSKIGSGDDMDLVYRLLRLGRRVGYVPQVRVQHNHGRKDSKATEQVTRRYVLGRGAFYLRYALQGDRWVARSAYWEIANLLKTFIRFGIVTRRARVSLKTIGLLIAGAARHLRHGQPPIGPTARHA